MRVLSDYHTAMGELVRQHGGTLERFTGDGMMIFFNDPVPCANPAERAVRLAIAMRECTLSLARDWQLRGYTLGFGIGIAQGYATMGRIGFEGRFDYAAIGTVTNVAARLCSEAHNNQILVTQRIGNTDASSAQARPSEKSDPVGRGARCVPDGPTRAAVHANRTA